MDKNYDSLSEAVSDLVERGYGTQFNLSGRCSESKKVHHSAILYPLDFNIDEVHYFHDNNNPEEEMVIFAISSHKHKAKGIVCNALSNDDAIVNPLDFLIRVKNVIKFLFALGLNRKNK